MKAYCITLIDHAYSERVAERCIRTAREVGGIHVEKYPAVWPYYARRAMETRGLKWTWGEGGAGLRHHPYGGDFLSRLGCAMSHLKLWELCICHGEPIMVLEHDAVFVGKFQPFDFKSVCQINDPAGATRKGNWWSARMRERGPGVWPKTWVTDPKDRIPDGLAGNSAYVIQPHAAKLLCELYQRYGVWPNDATMCAQLVPDLQEVFPFVTKVEQEKSTTHAV